ncbi:MAG TPA: glycosyltransferase family 1 protein [Pyrinomonadaceae bacterium]|jgi:glycosyltransferase involved in cell wall biosynthesis
MIVAFQNLFGAQYEGGANWLEVSLLGLGALPAPPKCLVVGASVEVLPPTLREASHVEAVPLVRRAESRGGRLLRGALRRVTRRPWEDVALREINEAHGVDLWVGFAGFEGLSVERRLLVWFPDFQFLHFPELFEPDDLRDRLRQWDFVARRADGILAISESVAEDARRSHAETASKTHVCGFPPVFPMSVLRQQPDEIRRKYSLPERFLLVSNQFWQHKNHALVVRALSHLKQCGKVPPVVAFTGRTHDYRRPDAFSALLRSVHEQGLHEFCRFLGVVPRDEQIALIRAAEAVVQPSLFEGRGAIGEEATVLGTQLLCSDIPVHRELNVPGALFFPTDGATELAALMERRYTRSNRDAAEIADESRRLALAYGERLLEIFEKVSGKKSVLATEQMKERGQGQK